MYFTGRQPPGKLQEGTGAVYLAYQPVFRVPPSGIVIKIIPVTQSYPQVMRNTVYILRADEGLVLRTAHAAAPAFHRLGFFFRL
jgi:hypothetical protein